MLTRLLHFQSKHDDLEIPDFGPVEIGDYDRFLQKSKELFNEKWQIASETVSFEGLNTNRTDQTPSKFDYIKVKLIGSGSFGKVYLVKNKYTSSYHALKAIAKSVILKYSQLEHTRTEKLVLLSINCPFTIRMDHYFKDNSYIYFLVPFVQGGELYRLLMTHGKFDEITAMFYAAQVILALEYLHTVEIVYRDLKPENMLIDHTGYLKVVDFGFCKRLTKGRTYTLCGTPEYLAPEVIAQKGYGKSVDWWGVGIFIYELNAGLTPFKDKKPIKIYENIMKGNYRNPPHFSNNLKDLVRHILQADISNRYGCLKNGIGDIKDHVWFRPMNWQMLVCRKLNAPIVPDLQDAEDASRFRTMEYESLKIADKDEFPEEFVDF